MANTNTKGKVKMDKGDIYKFHFKTKLKQTMVTTIKLLRSLCFSFESFHLSFNHIARYTF